MQLHVGSKHLASEVAVQIDVTGREHLVVMAKATWSIPEPGQRPRPLPPQPLLMTDDFHGQPGESAMRCGADVARFKPLCDVVFDAKAHAPGARPVTELIAGFELGPLRKLVRVRGPRHWHRAAGASGGYSLTAPGAFTDVPLHHGLALGGSRWYQHGKDSLCEAHPENPVGTGWAGAMTRGQMHQQAAPQLEHPDQAVNQPDVALKPHALGALGRNCQPRRAFAGTYDEAWRRDVFPLLPADFDEQFHQTAPDDQQMPYPRGGESVCLLNLLPDHPELRFALPRLVQQVRVLRRDYSEASPAAVVDTLYFETEQRRFSAVWRASVPLRRSLQEVSDVAVGPLDPLWWRERSLGGTGAGCRGCNQATEQVVEPDEVDVE